MGDMPFVEKKEIIGTLTVDEQRELIKDFKLEIIFNELETRIAERIELAKRLDSVMDFLNTITR